MSDARAAAPRLALILTSLALLGACASPNRGWWDGTFEGGVSGRMRFSISTRGTKASGEMEGTTSDGQAFRARFDGSLNQDYLRADIEGSSSTGTGLPAGFEGEIKGTLAGGAAEGSWQVSLVHLRAHYEGSWVARQE